MTDNMEETGFITFYRLKDNGAIPPYRYWVAKIYANKKETWFTRTLYGGFNKYDFGITEFFPSQVFKDNLSTLYEEVPAESVIEPTFYVNLPVDKIREIFGVEDISELDNDTSILKNVFGIQDSPDDTHPWAIVSSVFDPLSWTVVYYRTFNISCCRNIRLIGWFKTKELAESFRDNVKKNIKDSLSQLIGHEAPKIPKAAPISNTAEDIISLSKETVALYTKKILEEDRSCVTLDVQGLTPVQLAKVAAAIDTFKIENSPFIKELKLYENSKDFISGAVWLANYLLCKIKEDDKEDFFWSPGSLRSELEHIGFKADDNGNLIFESS